MEKVAFCLYRSRLYLRHYLHPNLEVSDEQVLGAAASLAMLSFVGGDVGICLFHDIGVKQFSSKNKKCTI
ncbi:MAG: hypothetical protein PUP91_04240 [Rhizonema sp. PD37]|nr:hypothetical protein [Rhizonema sp. PD37]